MIDATNWELSDALLTPTGLDVGWRAVQRVAGFAPRQGYSLVFFVRNGNTVGKCTVSVIFRTTAGEAFRTFSRTFQGSTAEQAGTINFRAPDFVGNAVVSITCANTRARIRSIGMAEMVLPPLTEPTVYNAASHYPPGYRLVFNDEFEQAELNREKWHTRLIQNQGTLDHLVGEEQRYRDSAVRTGGGMLRLTAARGPDGVMESGLIRSDATFLHGYFEARVKMPEGRGVWPAFWLAPDIGQDGVHVWPPEIDIFEFVNNGTGDLPTMVHSGVRNNSTATTNLVSDFSMGRQRGTAYYAPFDFTDGFHNIGCEWVPGLMRWFLDGRHIYTRECPWLRKDGSPAPRAHLILNLAIGGEWAGRNGVDPGPFEFLVNSVRVYQK